MSYRLGIRKLLVWIQAAGLKPMQRMCQDQEHMRKQDNAQMELRSALTTILLSQRIWRRPHQEANGVRTHDSERQGLVLTAHRATLDTFNLGAQVKSKEMPTRGTAVFSQQRLQKIKTLELTSTSFRSAKLIPLRFLRRATASATPRAAAIIHSSEQLKLETMVSVIEPLSRNRERVLVEIVITPLMLLRIRLSTRWIRALNRLTLQAHLWAKVVTQVTWIRLNSVPRHWECVRPRHRIWRACLLANCRSSRLPPNRTTTTWKIWCSYMQTWAVTWERRRSQR